jgi:hypothetical protein
MRNNRHESGMTLVELTLTSTILVTLIWLMATLSMTSVKSGEYAKRISKDTEAVDEILNSMKRNLESSVFILQLNARGLDYASCLAKLTTEKLIGVSFPVVDENGIFERETVARSKSGNALVFAEHYRTDEFNCVSGNTYRIPIYRFHAYYIIEPKKGSEVEAVGAFNFSMWISEPLADGLRIDNIANATDKFEVLQHLGDATPDVNGDSFSKTRLVWKVGGDPRTAGVFRYIDPLTSPALFDFASFSAIQIQPDPKSSRMDLLNFRGLGLAANNSAPQAGIAAFSQIDTTGDGFPHGFEVQITGPSSAREILLRIVIVDPVRGSETLYNRLHVVATTKQGLTS